MTSILWAPRSAGRTANASRTLGGHHYTIGRARYLSRSVVRWPVAAVNAGRRAASRCVMNAGNRPASLRHLDHNCSENGNLVVSMPSPGGRSARRIRISMIAADSHTIVSAPLPYRPSGQNKICPSETVHWFRTGSSFYFVRAIPHNGYCGSSAGRSLPSTAVPPEEAAGAGYQNARSAAPAGISAPGVRHFHSCQRTSIVC